MTDQEISNTEPQRDLVGYGGNPPHPRWPNNARLALSLVINYEEGAKAPFPMVIGSRNIICRKWFP